MTLKKQNSLNPSERGQPGLSQGLTAEIDRRREPRFAAEGQARLEVVGQAKWSAIEGELQDVSDGGFRLIHRHGGLTTGTEVRFSFLEDGQVRTGVARVCWNKIANGVVESGFYITGQR